MNTPDFPRPMEVSTEYAHEQLPIGIRLFHRFKLKNSMSPNSTITCNASAAIVH
jgi:hypothetical protein